MVYLNHNYEQSKEMRHEKCVQEKEQILSI